jgi:hypothetical protein
MIPKIRLQFLVFLSLCLGLAAVAPPSLAAFDYDGQNQTRVVYDGRFLSVFGYDSVAVPIAVGEAKKTAGAISFFGKSAEFLAAEETAPSLMYHYTTAPESSFANGLWEGSSVSDTLYTDPLQASQELGIPVPNKVIPIQNTGQFVPNSPFIIEQTDRFLGGGNDFINPQRVPPSQLLPARPIGGN